MLCDRTAVPPGACACGRACRHDGSGAGDGSIGGGPWARGCVAGGRRLLRGKQSQCHRRSSRQDTKMCIFMYPGDSAVYSPVAPTLVPLGAACNTAGQVCFPLRGESQRIPMAVSSDGNRREYLKRNHMDCDFMKPQTNANICMWSQSKTTNKQTFSGGFLKICVATEGLERGSD